MLLELMYFLSSMHGPQVMSEQEKSTTTLTLKLVCLTTGTRATMSSSLKGMGEHTCQPSLILQDCPAKSNYVLETVRNIPEFEVQIGVANFDMWVWSHMYTIIQPLKMSRRPVVANLVPAQKNPSDCVSGTPTGSGTTCLEVRGAFLTLPITFVVLISRWLVAGSMSLHNLETSLL